MNVWVEVDRLPRASQIALAGALLRTARPSVGEIALATGVCDSAVRKWMDIQVRRYLRPAENEFSEINPSLKG